MFESRKKAKEERERESQDAVERGWSLVSGYQLELIDDLFERYGVEGDADPYEYTEVQVDLRGKHLSEHVADDVIEDPFPPLAPPPQRRVSVAPTEAIDHGPPVEEYLSSLDDAQCRAVEALHTACTGWFGFFFRTLGGTDLERREIASRNLTNASRDLMRTAKDLAEAVDLPPERLEAATQFRTATEEWADAFDAISRGMLLDQQRVAIDGLDLMSHATETAERVGVSSMGATRRAVETLAYLDDLAPPQGATKSAARRAKDPWRRAVLAAGTGGKSRRKPKLDGNA